MDTTVSLYATDVIPVEEVVVRVRFLSGGRLPLEPLARHDRARRVEDVLRLQYLLVHRREQQCVARAALEFNTVIQSRHGYMISLYPSSTSPSNSNRPPGSKPT